MNTNTNTGKLLRRAAASLVLTAAPMLIALGAATVSHAEGGTAAPASSASTPAVPHTNQDIARSYGPHTSLSHHMRHPYQY